jgi:hypothetical protein
MSQRTSHLEAKLTIRRDGRGFVNTEFLTTQGQQVFRTAGHVHTLDEAERAARAVTALLVTSLVDFLLGGNGEGDAVREAREREASK